MDFWTIAKDYQEAITTLVVGILGFGGVIWTLRANAQLAREQHNRTVTHDRRVVRTALLEELRFLQQSFEERDRVIGKAETDGSDNFLVPTDTMTDAYHRLVDRIGLLTTEEAAKVIQAYLAVRRMPVDLRLVVEMALSGDLARDWIVVGRKHFAVLRAKHQYCLEFINDAITALETRVGE